MVAGTSAAFGGTGAGVDRELGIEVVVAEEVIGGLGDDGVHFDVVGVRVEGGDSLVVEGDGDFGAWVGGEEAVVVAGAVADAVSVF